MMSAIQAQTAETQIAIQKAQDDHETAMAKVENTIADTLKKLKEAMGADKIISPTVARAYQQTSTELVTDDSINRGFSTE